MQSPPAPGTPAIPQIAILGGGIGGLAAAAFLHRAGLPCTVYEQAAQLTEIGAGVVVAPNAARLPRRLGLLGAFTQRAVRLEVGWEFRRWQDGAVLSAEDLAARCEDLYGEHTYTAHRADLLGVLCSAVPPESIQLNRRCVEVSLRDTPVLRFSDGQVIEPDVLIGADGIHSMVRASLTEATPAVYSGLCAFRGLVPAKDAPAFARRGAQVLWLGPSHHLVHYPISGGRLVNLVAFAPAGDYTVESWTATATMGEFLSEFDGWDPRLIRLIQAAGTLGRWALLDRAPLRRWGLAARILQPRPRQPAAAGLGQRHPPSPLPARPAAWHRRRRRDRRDHRNHPGRIVPLPQEEPGVPPDRDAYRDAHAKADGDGDTHHRQRRDPAVQLLPSDITDTTTECESQYQRNQVLECGTLGSGGTSQVVYIWTYPSQDAFIVAQGEHSSTFSQLDAWWKAEA